jgi:MYXO-CTERM domain-containing protein
VDDRDGGVTEQTWVIDLTFTDDDDDGIADTCEVECDPDFQVGVQEDPNADFDNDGIDNQTECAQGTSMCVTNAPGAPVPLAPDDGELVEAVPVTLVVRNALDPDNDILEYRFEVFAAGDTENPVFEEDEVQEGGRDTSLTVPAQTFEEDADYLWRARASDAFAAGPFSDLRRFRVSLDNDPPSVPSPVTPDGAATVLRPTLVAGNAVDPEGEALTYAFEVYVDNGGLPELLHQSSGNPEGDGQTGWQLEEDLTENVSYLWRVRATDVRDLSGLWSEMLGFRVNTQNSLPRAPELLWPPQDAAVGVQPVVLIAREAIDDDGDQLEYVFTVATDQGFEAVIATSDRVVPDVRGEVTFTLPSPSEDQEYSWRVQAFDGEGGGAPATRQFRFSTQNVAPPAVTVQAPAEGESVPVVDPDFVWINVVEPDGDSVVYDVEIYADAEMGVSVYTFEGVLADRDETTSLAGPALADNTAFWWRVRAVDEAGLAGPFSDLTAFFVNVRNEPPEAPVLAAPVGEDLAFGEELRFTWNNSFDPDGDVLLYTIEVFSVGGARLARKDGLEEGEDGTTSWSSPAMDPGVYTWHVRATDAERDGPWSVDAVFVVAEDGPHAVDDPEPEPMDPAAFPEPTESCNCQTPARPSGPGWVALLGLALLVTGRGVLAMR